MKVILLVPNTRSKQELNEVPLVTPPLNLMYLAQSLADEGHNVKIIDAYLYKLNINQIIKECKKRKPEMILIPLYSTDLYITKQLTDKLKIEIPLAKIVLGGPHPSHLPMRTMQEFPSADIATIGEGEFTTKKIAIAIESNSTLQNIKGIIYRNKEQIIQTPPAETIKDLDSISIPERSLLEHKKYYSRMFNKNPVDVIITSRGCPYQCIFCAKINKDFTGYRMRSVDNVMKEIRMISDNGAKSLEIYDESFTVNKKRTYEILKQMKQEKIDLEFRVRTRVNIVNKELLSKLKKQGCSIISYGVESGNQRILNLNKKATELNMIQKAFNITNKTGIATLGFFLIGLKGDTPRTVQQTINFAKKLNPHYATFGHVIPYPGTEFYNEAKQNNTLHGDWHVDKPMPYVKLPWLQSKEQALKLVSDAYKQFYYRPAYAATYMYRLIKRGNINQMTYSIKNLFSDLREVNSVVVNDVDEQKSHQK